MYHDKSKIENLEKYFRSEVPNNYKAPDKNQSFVSVENTLYHDGSQDFTPLQSEESKASKFWRNRSHIEETCRMFFAFVKPRGAKNGTRLILLYAPPFVALLDHQHEELEIIPSSTHFYFEGRFLFLSNEGNERVFSIKCDEKKLVELTKNNGADDITQYFRMCQLNRYIVPPIFLTYPFYDKVINTANFYFYLSKIPSNYWKDDLIDNFIRASDPMLDELYEKLFDDYFKPMEYEDSSIPKNNFLFTLLHYSLLFDEEINSFKISLDKAKNVQNSFVIALEYMPFIDRTRMIFHLLFVTAERYFPNGNLASKVILNVVLKYLAEYLDHRKLPEKAQQLRDMMDLKRGELSHNLYKRYLAVGSKFRDQPSEFQLIRKGTCTYDSFIVVLHFVWSNQRKFMEILEGPAE